MTSSFPGAEGSQRRASSEMSGRVYLDWAATAPLRPDVGAAMVAQMARPPGNPTGAHAEARGARRDLDDARDKVASLTGVSPGDVVFTSGGTEADGLAIHGAYDAQVARGGPSGAVVCSAIEHHAVLEACRSLALRTGAELRLVGVTSDGVVDLEALAAACTDDVAVVSVMAVNNEVGVVQPIDRVAATVRNRAPRAVLHTDAVQAAPWLDVAPLAEQCDLVTLSAHKFGGPVGTGALLVGDGIRIQARLDGGGQERGRRSGTPNVVGAVGMAAALEATVEDRVRTTARIMTLRNRLEAGLAVEVPGIAISGGGASRVPGICHLRIPGVESEALVVLLDQMGVASSAGASCSSGATEPSHVLEAMGLGRSESRTGLRLSMGVTTSDGDVDRALAIVPAAVAQLRD